MGKILTFRGRGEGVLEENLPPIIRKMSRNINSCMAMPVVNDHKKRHKSSKNAAVIRQNYYLVSVNDILTHKK